MRDDDLEEFVSKGLQNYNHAVQISNQNNVIPYIITFLLSLSHSQFNEFSS